MSRLLCLLAALILPLHEAVAETADQKGLSIAMEMDRRDTGWGPRFSASRPTSTPAPT